MSVLSFIPLLYVSTIMPFDSITPLSLKGSRRAALEWAQSYSIDIQFDSRKYRKNYIELFESEKAIVYNDISNDYYSDYTTVDDYVDIRRSLTYVKQPRYVIESVSIIGEIVMDSIVQTKMKMTQVGWCCDGTRTETCLVANLMYNMVDGQCKSSSITKFEDTISSLSAIRSINVLHAEEKDADRGEILMSDSDMLHPVQEEPVVVRVLQKENNTIVVAVLNTNEEYITANIYDNTGKRIKALDMGNSPAVWSSVKLNNGKYYVDVRVGGFTRNEIIVIK